MMGLAGLEFTSATGNKFHSTPSARDSWATISPNFSASSGLPVAPKAMACGNTVVPFIRIDGPRSKSAVMISGSSESRCSVLVQTVAS